MLQSLKHRVTPLLHIHPKPKTANDDILARKKDTQIWESRPDFRLHGHDAVQKDRPGMLNASGRIMGTRLMVVNGQVYGLAIVNQGFHLGEPQRLQDLLGDTHISDTTEVPAADLDSTSIGALTC